MNRAGQFSIRALFAVTGVMAVAMVAHRQVYFGTPVLRVVAWSVPAMLVILCHAEIQRLLDRIPAMIAGKPLSALAPTNEKPQRWWLRFSVRTLLVVVTVFCVWLAWQASVVRARKAMAAELNGEIARSRVLPVNDAIVKRMKTIDVLRKTDPDKSFSIPWYRELLGDEAMLYVVAPAERMDEAARLFPEAAIVDRATVED